VDGGQITFTDGDTFDSNLTTERPAVPTVFVQKDRRRLRRYHAQTGTGSNLDIGSVANFGNTVKAQVDLD